jgi:hypothetical protein
VRRRLGLWRGGEKWINPLKDIANITNSPWFKPWAINDKQNIITVSTV